ncbi:type 4a pilus biogenesis protein PilO [Sulfurospirillum sp. T05]|uniref:Type 4a pilus biogenesis protein PilO n=1 Tax=Sulfurospirillum tamanense TaxID=2813362 RepID=A0ABS2WUW0_9BACT|nr:type 4a pilus biogenesis protein PilO [Sulfurospirillum tamanensis]MBN2965368.1 type 4a pilus biogenesis protein PilO [Sulfurospirillum tamanensis]
MDALLEKIDAFFDAKKPNEASILMLMIGILVAFLVYTYAFPPAESFLKKNERAFGQITAKVNEESAYLASVTVNGNSNFHVERLRGEIEQTKINLERITYTNGFVDNKLKELSYLLFNDKNWANFLDHISFLAKQHNINLLKINNEFKEPSLQKIEQVLTISIDLKGNFGNVLRFINAIEESRLVVDIYEMSLESAQALDGSLKIAVWGMKY